MQFIKPNWLAPSNVNAFTTTRQQGNSLAAFSSFNLADHVGDEPEKVVSNRMLLTNALSLPDEPVWLQQEHSSKVLHINGALLDPNPIADASLTSASNKVCVVMTADCLPILVCDKNGAEVAAIHAGWRGLAGGVIENTIAAMNTNPSDLLVWLGPAIGPRAFEVSSDVIDAFASHDLMAMKAFKLKTDAKDKWLANIYLLAMQRLNSMGVTAIYGGEFCTYSDQKNFYSYRRDHGITGRMATLIWLSA